MFSLLVLMLYPDAITDGMLKGLGQQLHSVRYNTLTSLLDVGMLAILLPTHGMGGFLAAFTVSHGVNFFLSLSRLIRVTGYLPRFRATVKAALAVGAGLFVLRGIPIAPTIPGVLLGCGVFLGVYGALILLTGALTKEDIRWIVGMARRKKPNRPELGNSAL